MKRSKTVKDSGIRILLIRYSSMDHIHDIVDRLKNAYPTSAIHLLVQSDIQDVFKGKIKVSCTRAFERGDLKPGRKLFQIMREMRKKKFDMVVIPYNNLFGRGLSLHRRNGVINNSRKSIDVPQDAR